MVLTMKAEYCFMVNGTGIEIYIVTEVCFQRPGNSQNLLQVHGFNAIKIYRNIGLTLNCSMY